MQKNPPKEVGLLRKFISTAHSVTTNQVGLPLGILRVQKNLAWLADYGINPLSEEERRVVDGYYERIRELPIGDERLLWAPEVRVQLDAKMERITAKYREKLLAMLARVVAEAS